MTDVPPFPLRDRIAAALTTACPRHSHCDLMGPAVWAVVRPDIERLERLLSEKEAEVDDKSDVGHTVAEAWMKRAEEAEVEAVMQRSRADRAEGELEVLHAALEKAGGIL